MVHNRIQEDLRTANAKVRELKLILQKSSDLQFWTDEDQSYVDLFPPTAIGTVDGHVLVIRGNVIRGAPLTEEERQKVEMEK